MSSSASAVRSARAAGPESVALARELVSGRLERLFPLCHKPAPSADCFYVVAETCAINVEAALNWPVPVEAIINGCLLASESSVAVADTAGGVHTAEATCITVADKVGNVVESIESVSGYFE